MATFSTQGVWTLANYEGHFHDKQFIGPFELVSRLQSELSHAIIRVPEMVCNPAIEPTDITLGETFAPLVIVEIVLYKFFNVYRVTLTF